MHEVLKKFQFPSYIVTRKFCIRYIYQKNRQITCIRHNIKFIWKHWSILHKVKMKCRMPLLVVSAGVSLWQTLFLYYALLDMIHQLSRPKDLVGTSFVIFMLDCSLWKQSNRKGPASATCPFGQSWCWTIVLLKALYSFLQRNRWLYYIGIK